MQQIILDTNFLLIPGTVGVDIFAEIDRIIDVPYELCIVEESLKELDHIIEKEKQVFKKAASLAKQLIKAKNLTTIKQKSLYTNTISTEDKADNHIVDAAQFGAIVATQDRGLKNRLKKKNIKSIVLKNKKYLDFE